MKPTHATCWWTNSRAPAALLTLKSSGLSDCSANQLSAKTETQKNEQGSWKERRDRFELWELIGGGNWQRPHDRAFKYLSYYISGYQIHRSPGLLPTLGLFNIKYFRLFTVHIYWKKFYGLMKNTEMHNPLNKPKCFCYRLSSHWCCVTFRPDPSNLQIRSTFTTVNIAEWKNENWEELRGEGRIISRV